MQIVTAPPHYNARKMPTVNLRPPRLLLGYAAGPGAARRRQRRTSSKAPRLRTVRAEAAAVNNEHTVEENVIEMTGLQARLSQAGMDAARIMNAEDEHGAWQLCIELEDLKKQMAHNPAAFNFVTVLQGMLSHTASPAADNLDSQYLSALNKICMAIEGSGWKIVEPGKAVNGGASEMKFSSWEEVAQKQAARQAAQNGQPDAEQRESREATSEQAAGHDDLYRVLGLQQKASKEDIKAAFRKLALEWHPDVNQQPDAEQRFMEISGAYDVLSDEQSRKLYDRFGLEGMRKHEGAKQGAGNSRRDWEEFTPYKRSNKSTQARDASRMSYDAETSSSDAPPSSEDRVPQNGDLVEYPLCERVKAEYMDGRSHGVGLLVNCNQKQAGRHKLPDEKLGLCEIEPLRQETAGADKWVLDELATFTVCHIKDLRRISSVTFDYRFDSWVIRSELSPGCGGPEIVEEVMY